MSNEGATGPAGDEAATAHSAAVATASVTAQVDRLVARLEPELIRTRRHIHAHPELSGLEFRTAALVSRRLRTGGLRPRVIPARNGVLCDIGSGERVVALRADLDALPLADAKNVPYKSTVDNVCHACGHDVHTATVLGAGLVLAELDRQGLLPGRVRLVFQPSEEKVPTGAPVMIKAGALSDVDAIFALHCNPQLDAGTVGVRAGAFTAAADRLDITLTGPGGHTARPHLTVDLVHALGKVVAEVPSMLSHRLDPRYVVSVVFGTINAGEAANAIPSVGTASAMVRSLSFEAWEAMPGIVEETVQDAVHGTGAIARVTYQRGVPPVTNDPVATSVVAAAATEALGAANVVPAELSMGAEDFSFYLQHVPGAMFRLGTRTPGADEVVDIHQPRFDVDERCIAAGVRVLVQSAITALTEPALGH
jgi:amidohydrolase